MEISKRHLLKSFTWRIIGSIDTVIFSWLITNDLNLSLGLTGVSTFTKIVLYYFHEKFWYHSEIKTPKSRHLLKTITWRVIAILDTFIITWFLFNNPLISIRIGFAETVSKMILYWIHEKIWYKSNYGLIKPRS